MRYSQYVLSRLLVSENILQLYPVGVTLKGLLLTNIFVIGQHSLRMDEHYHNLICVFLTNRSNTHTFCISKCILCSTLVHLIFPIHYRIQQTVNKSISTIYHKWTVIFILTLGYHATVGLGTNKLQQEIKQQSE